MIIHLRGIELISCKKPIISSSPLSDIMQAMEKGNSQEKVKRVPIYVNPHVRDAIMQLRRGNQTYGDVVEESITQTLRSAVSPAMFANLHAIGRYPLLKPMNFDVLFDEENRLWCVENNETAISGYGTSYGGIIEGLEDCIDGHLLVFARFPDEKLSADSLEVKRKLKEYLDFDSSYKLYQEKYGDV
ncbi:MAG TPA: hypothetical protein O0Y06_06515 [Methanocorpusculum sp.]|nr:hypothetical protein [Methanocorpusculum sp.]HJK80538.1 hypothetical protein [Methanocorpusculum sp.]